MRTTTRISPIDQVEDYLRGLSVREAESDTPTLSERFAIAFGQMRDTLRRVFPYVLLGVGIGAVIHNATQKYYCTLELEGKGFFADGEFVYGGYSGYTGNHEKSAADAVKGSAYLQSDSKYYSATKLN